MRKSFAGERIGSTISYRRRDEQADSYSDISVVLLRTLALYRSCTAHVTSEIWKVTRESICKTARHFRASIWSVVQSGLLNYL
jgi:hypothetical protein